jgi:hypothetical protein
MADSDTGSEYSQPQTPDDPQVAERFRADALRGNVVKPEEDPFDPARLRITVDPASAVATRTITFTVPVRSRPDPHTFFRVHPEWYFDAYLLELKEQRVVYLISPDLAPDLEGELKAVTLYTAIYRGGSPFLWYVALPGPEGRKNDWTASAREIAQLAMTEWVRLVSDMSAGAYIAMATSVPMPEPKWPDTTFSTLLRKAFKEKIASLDHPVIRELRGEA